MVPDQQSGIESNTENSVILSNEAEAKGFFQMVRERLLQVNNWHQIAGKATADFKLTDKKGNDVQRTVQQDDHFKIDIPGPGPRTGDGFDWVQVEAVEETGDADGECVAVRVRPATNPLNDRHDVAHFFSDEATSSFIVRRDGTKITAGVYGRNEKPNTKAETIVDKVRNTTIGTGAVSGFSKLQWKSLVTGLLKRS